ncbi:MAG: FtsW/RodA/SpoVE family cell cycle protein, partial [Acidobacteriota bacterium]|nr:FtsW/RodA/SpoVE family cell cycle protein [Acidobacteriota bacterium]
YCKKRDYRSMRSPQFAFGVLGVVLILLIAVYFVDGRAHRWFRFPLGSIQPSEFAKPALVLFLAYFLTRHREFINDKRTILQAGLTLAVLAITVVVADLGTAMVLVATALVMFFVAGLNPKYFGIAVAGITLFAGLAVAVKPYRLARLIQFVDPEFLVLDAVDSSGKIKKYLSDSVAGRGGGYQIQQAKIALASGGLTGLGLMGSNQKWMFLPEAHTDTIYAIVGEELGFGGCVAILAGFLIITWRGLRLYWTAPDDFGRYIALGVTASIVIQALINISVVLDLGPTKGIPLPMISFGGSSLLSTLLSLGMLMSVSEQAG